ncbi:MAG: PilZ domain-containing protein [Deltaproteobacteria bacterium]|nr:PilZ domain-containing protein [Deltaproteobacteria bacterium]
MDNRSAPRVSIGKRAWCEGERITLYLQIVNASTGGLFLRTATPLPKGEHARVIFRLDDETEIVAEAEVVWTGPGPSSVPGMGLRLVQIEAGADAYESFLSHVRRPLD